MILCFAIRYGSDSKARKEILNDIEEKKFPAIEDWICPMIDKRVWPMKGNWVPDLKTKLLPIMKI